MQKFRNPLSALAVAAVLPLAVGTGAAAADGGEDGGDDRPQHRGGQDRGDDKRDHRGRDKGHEHGGDSVLRLQDAAGDTVGVVELDEARGGGTEVSVKVKGLQPGFHGFHVHSIGQCEPDSADPEDPSSTGDFLSAGGHLNPDGSDHGNHAGDLPPLLVSEDGTASQEFVTDRFAPEDLRDEDGSAVMVHSDRDNFANIPERYGGPDEETLGAGDAGDRVACGVVPG